MLAIQRLEKHARDDLKDRFMRHTQLKVVHLALKKKTTLANCTGCELRSAAGTNYLFAENQTE